MTPKLTDVCRCGHDYDTHTHLRYGQDCGRCGRFCYRFRPQRWWHRRGTR